MNATLKTQIVQRKKVVVTPKKYLAIVKEPKKPIKRTSFIIPKIGSKSLGNFIIEYE